MYRDTDDSRVPSPRVPSPSPTIRPTSGGLVLGGVVKHIPSPRGEGGGFRSLLGLFRCLLWDVESTPTLSQNKVLSARSGGVSSAYK
jgi:hypothetical protein